MEEPGARNLEPEIWMSQLVRNIQIVACLRWLCEFNILPCIPQQQPVSYEDLSQLALVPEGHLRRVCRMLISAEFLEETASTHVGHTALSYAFVNSFALSDGLAFLTETIVPASLKMVEASKSFDKADRSPYSAAFGTSTSFTDQALPHGRLSRQFDHFMRCIANDTGNGLLSILRRLNINGDKEALVVDVSCTSLTIVRTLAVLHPRLSFVAQFVKELPPTDGKALPEALAPRIQCLRQSNPEKQPIRNASTYILFLQSIDTNDAAVSRQVLNCIKAHADILRCNSDAKLVILAATSPAAEVDWHKHVAHMCRFQLAHGVPLDRLELCGILDEALRNIPGLCLAGMTVSENGDFCIYEIASKGLA
ncbi:hypothetical protein CC80DRAFT_595636 [Byssothecium circinans]|uniref:O-methyltransferase domain-containing protein n=1 Tax=Byssothecium circinans TaxID=147558 RepID=A0A6A5TQ03_9PLEO|nr:hypothetical protein CC80DRAFT_595636 [Byssothecium circinans]